MLSVLQLTFQVSIHGVWFAVPSLRLQRLHCAYQRAVSILFTDWLT